MLNVGDEGAIVVIGLFAVVAVGWGANLSVRSALRGPAWALGHVTGVSRYLLIPFVLGGLLTFLVRPLWVGLAAMYVVSMVWWLSGLLRRSLLRLQEVGGFDEIPADRRSEIVDKAKRYLYLGGTVLAAIGVAGFGVSPATAGVTLALAVVLIGTGLLLREEAQGAG